MKYLKILSIIMIIICPAITVGQVTLSIPDVTIEMGETQAIAVHIKVEADDVYSLSAEFEFDSEHLEFVTKETGDTISESLLAEVNQVDQKVYLSMASIYPLTEDGVLIYFMVKPKSQSVSTFDNVQVKVNEDEPIVGVAKGLINSITSPILVTVQGDTAEVRNSVTLNVGLSGLLGRELNSFELVLDYKAANFQLQDFSASSIITENNFTIEAIPLSNNMLQISGSSSTPITEDGKVGSIILFAHAEGEFDLKVVEATFNDGEIDAVFDFSKTLLTQDVTAPSNPGNVSSAIQNQGGLSIIELDWDEVSATDLSHYVIIQSFGGSESEFKSNSNTFSDSVTASGTYTYSIKAVDGSGNISGKSSEVEVDVNINDITAPPAPVGLSADIKVETSFSIVELSWDEITISDFSHYLIKKSTAATDTEVESESNSLRDTVATSGSYTYSVRAVDEAGNISEYSEDVVVDITITSNNTERDFPSTFKLEQNYPNPFNPSTVISYQLAENSEVKLDIFDMTGRKLATLVNERKAAGSYTASFDASALSSGIYIYRLTADNFTQTKKMTLLK